MRPCRNRRWRSRLLRYLPRGETWDLGKRLCRFDHGDTGIARLTVPKTAGAGDYAIRLLASRPNAYLETPLTVNLTVAQAQFTGVGLAYSTAIRKDPPGRDAVDGKISAKFNARYEKAFDVSLTSGDERPNGRHHLRLLPCVRLPEGASFEGNVLSLSAKSRGQLSHPGHPL